MPAPAPFQDIAIVSPHQLIRSGGAKPHSGSRLFFQGEAAATAVVAEHCPSGCCSCQAHGRLSSITEPNCDESLTPGSWNCPEPHARCLPLDPPYSLSRFRAGVRESSCQRWVATPSWLVLVEQRSAASVPKWAMLCPEMGHASPILLSSNNNHPLLPVTLGTWNCGVTGIVKECRSNRSQCVLNRRL